MREKLDLIFKSNFRGSKFHGASNDCVTDNRHSATCTVLLNTAMNIEQL